MPPSSKDDIKLEAISNIDGMVTKDTYEIKAINQRRAGRAMNERRNNGLYVNNVVCRRPRPLGGI